MLQSTSIFAPSDRVAYNIESCFPTEPAAQVGLRQSSDLKIWQRFSKYGYIWLLVFLQAALAIPNLPKNQSCPAALEKSEKLLTSPGTLPAPVAPCHRFPVTSSAMQRAHTVTLQMEV